METNKCKIWWHCGKASGSRAQDSRVVGSIPALATFDEIILGQGANTDCASLHPGVKMGTWSVVMSVVCGCTLLYAFKHGDQG